MKIYFFFLSQYIAQIEMDGIKTNFGNIVKILEKILF